MNTPAPLSPAMLDMLYMLLVGLLMFGMTQAAKSRFAPEGGTKAAVLAAVMSALAALVITYAKRDLVGLPTDNPDAFLMALLQNIVTVYAVQTGLFKLIYKPAQEMIASRRASHG